MTKRPRRIVRVVWRDAGHLHLGEWADKVDRHGMEVESVGYVVRRTKAELVVAQTIDRDNGNMTGVFSIPRSAIIRVRRLT